MKSTIPFSERVKSLQSQVGSVYVKPSVEKLEQFQKNLAEDVRASDYLEVTRGLSKATIKKFQLGYDKEKDAIAIPVFKRGELINIRYRLLEPGDKPKYTQEKGCEVWIYNEEGIQEGLAKGHVFIVEGEFDLMSTWQAGIKAVISPASGKDSYGVWLELIENIPRVLIAYDNDKPGKETAMKMAERIGIEKCKEIIYPHDCKDANEYFKKKTIDDFKVLVKEAKPFYNYQFKGVADVINDLRFKKGEHIMLQHLPEVKIPEDYLIVISGQTNTGKTSMVMNLVSEFVDKNIPTLVLPFERGSQVVGTRFLQVKYNYTEDDFNDLDVFEWEKLTKECLDLPLYFAMPTKDETIDLIIKSKRIFNTKVVVIDHLDYMIRSTQNKEAEIGNTLQALKRVAEEHKIIMIVITHTRKIEQAGSTKKSKPNLDDLKGSSSLSQDPECVAMLSSPGDGMLEVNILKNKGKMVNRTFAFNKETGNMGKEVDQATIQKDTEDWGEFSSVIKR